ncbi:MAG: sensor domain-containing phosphodiesterase [Dehalococcoidia bacterium]|nr:sensor domain-containing phosphodiesterase [Dehalococcoidia bacterium]
MPLRALLWLPLIVVAGSSAAFAGVLAQNGFTSAIVQPLIVSGVAATFAAWLFLRANRAAIRWVSGATVVAQDLAEGRLDARMPTTHIAEFDSLGQQMNRMAQSIQEKTEHLRRQAYHDTLTGLPNRAHFMVRAREALRMGRPGTVSVLFMDLDRFKVLNDTLGHAAGDSLLQVVANRLQEVTGQLGLVARLGGDEFTILVFDPRSATIATQVADRIVEHLRHPFDIDGHAMFVTVSVGISTNDSGTESVTDLMRKADVALYRAKGSGKARYAVFDAGLDEISIEQLHLDAELRSAVSDGQLRLFYQPEIDLRSGQLLGMEALLRWEHPHRGILSPSEFIALAEETGEILRIGSWVVEHACRDIMELSTRNPAARDLGLAVNLSAPEFKEQSLVAEIGRALKRTGMPPHRLKLELTESILMDDIQATLRTLEQLNRLGVKLAIDDFGTGYSSLAYLQSLPVDTLKIDQSFVRRIGAAPRSNAILSTVVDLGAALDLHVVAEGIESEEQLRFLREAGCPAGQGYLFSPPVTIDDFAKTLDHGATPALLRGIPQRRAS